ncbi:unnamed protein product [Dovyalis caffra]|uniref:rRNA N-glycosylase n=1 Tax=Dovyalis caffra TaxID=77055 RepID=A0AAV1SK00_9ROSI|nr:unnamed protein product [Dovyalis caffra]
MKALLQITTIWVWLTVVIVPGLVCPSVIEETKAPQYKTVTFNFKGATETGPYKDFVVSLRNEVKHSTDRNGLPVTAKTADVSKRLVLVDLKIDSEKFITLAINVIDLYVVGYRDKYNGKDRANFLKDAPKVARDNLFEEAKQKSVDRKTIQLGVGKLQKAIDDVYGKNADTKIEAKFFIISIQMVSEAARFQYILNKVLEGGIYGSYKPDFKATSLETNWDKISKAIQNADAASGEFRPPTSSVSLQDEKGKAWIVKKVSDIKNDMGLLKGQASKFSQLMQAADI